MASTLQCVTRKICTLISISWRSVKGSSVVDMEALYRPETAVFGSRTTTQPVLPLTLKSPAEERWGEVGRHRRGGFFFFFLLQNPKLLLIQLIVSMNVLKVGVP